MAAETPPPAPADAPPPGAVDAPPPAAPNAPPPTPAEAAPPTAASPRRRPRLLLRSTATTVLGVLLMAAALVGAVLWLLGTTTGMNAAIAMANRFAPVKIETRGSFGSLLGEFGFAELRVTVDGTEVSATGVRAQLRRALWQPPRLEFIQLVADTLRVEVEAGDPDSAPAEDIGIPLHVEADLLRLGALTVAVGDGEFGLQSIEARARAGPTGYRIDDGRVALGANQAQVTAELGAARPFSLTAQGQVQSDVQGQVVGAAVQVAGSLEEMTIDAQLSGAARGTARAVVASFAEPALRSLSAELEGVDPRQWHAGAPRADLAIQATLAPEPGMERATGTVAVVNRAPGPIDADRIPARSARAAVDLDATRLRFERIAAQLAQGTASGDFTLALADGSWQAQARLADVDPALLHGALMPMRIDGSLRARQTGETVSVTAQLQQRARPAAQLDFDGTFTPQRATIAAARLALDDGYATAAGTVELTAARRADVQIELHRFEPGRLVRGIDARLTGSAAIAGVLSPRPAGTLRFELADSRAWGRPLAGRGRSDTDGAQRLDADVELAVRAARLVARGGLGAPGRVLDVTLDAPNLADLLPATGRAAITGGVSLAGSASGDLTTPQFTLSLAGKGLRYGEHQLDHAQAKASYGGGADGEVSLAAALTGYRYAPQPRATVQNATVSVEGRLSLHAIRLQGTADRRHAAALLADGGWRDGAWRGRVREATIGPPFDLRLLTPAPLAVGADGFAFGPAELAIAHVRFDELKLRADESGFLTQGRFDGLQPMRFAVPIEGALAPVLPPVGEQPMLTLRGRWDFRLNEGIVDGHARVERASGDLYAGRGPDSALGLIDAWLDLQVEVNQLEAIARIESERNGGLGAHLAASLEDSAEAGWRLAQRHPWLLAAAFDLPTLEWINALLSDHLRANVRLGGILKGTLRVEGTPADPRASGQLSGDELRAAWVEQGMRLENGRLRAQLRDDLLLLEELNFSGPPRVRPDDRRAAAATPEGRVGSVSASGQVRLSDLTGVIQVAATHLPLLQRPDRWVLASGGANIETSARHVQINGAFLADAGFASLAVSELPSLSSDVYVIAPGEPGPLRDRRATFGFDLGIDLGPAFYLRGRGLNTRVEGAVRLRSTGRGAVTMIGSIEAVDGVYEGFGQKLSIARGRLNFQGAPENPGLDVLALRTGLPVEVGVTITRTASDPLLRLHSDPPMSDAEALSWLVLGRPLDQGGSDNIALVQAAAMLLAGGGEGAVTRTARAFGVDEISIRSGNLGIASLLPARGVAGALRSEEASAATVAGEIITVGKHINEQLTISYEQALSGTSRLLLFNYRLSRNLSAVVRAGTDNALELVYSIAFD